MSERKTRKNHRSKAITTPQALAKQIEVATENAQSRSLDGAPGNLDVARMLPHLRSRPMSNRPQWVERRAMILSES